MKLEYLSHYKKQKSDFGFNNILLNLITINVLGTIVDE